MQSWTKASRRHVPQVRFDWRLIMEPIFLGLVFGIMWLSASLLAEDLETLHATERRLQRCPAHA